MIHSSGILMMIILISHVFTAPSLAKPIILDVTADPPVAEFSSSSPVLVNTPVEFTNLTTGSEPIDYLWDFGDGGTSATVNPTHTYTATGTYIVTLVASNAVGEDMVTHTVEVVEAVGYKIFLPLVMNGLTPQ